MSYLPPLKIDDAAFPTVLGQDVLTSIRMIEERWRRHYPSVDYLPLDKRVTPISTPAQISGEAGSTKMDAMWGESVDASMTTWTQPQTTANAVAAEPNVYLAGRPIHARIMRSARDNDLKKHGFDRLRDLIACFPTSMLDAKGISVQAGDRFVWNSELYEVIQHHVEGWWYQTNVNLFVWVNAQHARRGS